MNSPEELNTPDWINNIPHETSRATIAKGYANSQRLDPKVQQARELLVKIVNPDGTIHDTDMEAFDELVDSMPVFQSGFVTIGHADIAGPEGVDNSNPTLMLASSSKRFLVEQLFSELLKLGKESYNLVFPLTYAGLAEALYREQQFGTSNGILSRIPTLVKYVDEDGKIKLTPEEFDQLGLKVDFETLAYLVLTLSCNNALTSAMGALYELWEVSGKTANRKESQERFARTIRFETAPGYELRINSNGTYAVQPASNGEAVLDLVSDIDYQIVHLKKTQVAEKALVREAIRNNKSDFGFDFTNSTLGKKLIDEGYDIYEKTGSYMSVYWMPKLASQGYPPHIVMLTTVSIVAPNGKVTSFVYYELIHMPFSPDPADAPGDTVENWPDEDSPRYTKFAEAVETNNKIGFRQRMIEKVEGGKIINEG